MPDGETLSPATSPYSVSSGMVMFDSPKAGSTDEELVEYVVNALLYSDYTDIIKLSETTTAEDLRDYLIARFRFIGGKDPALENRLNEKVPFVVKEVYKTLFNDLQWRSKVVPEPESGDGRHYQAFSAPSGRGAVGTAADPVNLFNGLFSNDETDLELDGAGCRFSFTRCYRQSSAYNGPLGYSWDHNYNLWLSAARPNATSRNAASVGKETNTISHRSARSCGDAARRAWRLSSGRIAASLMS
jgi:hypothetical protein